MLTRLTSLGSASLRAPSALARVSLRACARSLCSARTGPSSGRSAWPSCRTAARWRSRAAPSRRPMRTPTRTRTRRCSCAPTRVCCSRSPTASTAARSSELAIEQARARATELVQASGEAFRARGGAARATPCAARSRAQPLALVPGSGGAARRPDRAGQLRRLERLAGGLARRANAARTRSCSAIPSRSRALGSELWHAQLARPAGERIALVSDGVTTSCRSDREIPGPPRRGAERSRSRARDRARRVRGGAGDNVAVAVFAGARGSVRASRARSPWRSP